MKSWTNNAMRDAFWRLKEKYKNRHWQLQDLHEKKMSSLKHYMKTETKWNITFDRYEKKDDIYEFEFHIYPKKVEDNKVIFKYLVDNLNWFKKEIEASNSWKWVEIVDEWKDTEHCLMYFRYLKEDVRQTWKEYDKQHEINIKKDWWNSFFSSMNIDIDKVKALEWKEIKIYDESCEAFPKKLTVEKVDIINQRIYFSKEVMLGWHYHEHGWFWTRIIDIKLLDSTKIYDVDYNPNYKLPEDSDEFSMF